MPDISFGAAALSPKDVVGEFYLRLGDPAFRSWGMQLAFFFESNQASETYKWLGQAPQLAEWQGGRVLHYLSSTGMTIVNKHYESTLAFKKEDWRRDKTGQIMVRVADQARRANTHFNKLVSDLITAGPSTVCYDGQFFFDTDHAEGASGTQSNDLTVNISGSPTAPTVQEAADVILTGAQKIMGFLDDQGEPMNEDAREFVVVAPTPLYAAYQQAVSMALFPNGGSNPVAASGDLKVRCVMNARSTATDTVTMFRTDGIGAKPFVLQEEGGQPMTDFLGEGSDHAFKHGEYLFGVEAWRGAGYGFWQHACMLQMT